MGWSTDALVLVHFNKETLNSYGDFEALAESNTETINRAIERLKSLALMTEPKKFVDDSIDPLAWLENEVQEWTEILEEAVIDRYKAQLVLDAWPSLTNEKGNLVKKMEWKEMREAQCVDGDFIKLRDKNNNIIKDGNEIHLFLV